MLFDGDWSHPHIAVCGAYSSGKSTWIKYLSGVDAIPSGAFHSRIPFRLINNGFQQSNTFIVRWLGLQKDSSTMSVLIRDGLSLDDLKRVLKGLFSGKPDFSGPDVCRLQSCTVVLLEVVGFFPLIPITGSIIKIPSLSSTDPEEIDRLLPIFTAFNPLVQFTFASQTWQIHDVIAFEATQKLIDSVNRPTRPIFVATKLDLFSIWMDHGCDLSAEHVFKEQKKRYKALGNVSIIQKVYNQLLPDASALDTFSTHFVAVDALSLLRPHQFPLNDVDMPYGPQINTVEPILTLMRKQILAFLQGVPSSSNHDRHVSDSSQCSKSMSTGSNASSPSMRSLRVKQSIDGLPTFSGPFCSTPSVPCGLEGEEGSGSFSPISYDTPMGFHERYQGLSPIAASLPTSPPPLSPGRCHTMMNATSEFPLACSTEAQRNDIRRKSGPII